MPNQFPVFKNPMKTFLSTFALVLIAASLTADTGALASAVERGLIEEEVNRDMEAAIAAYESAVAHFDRNRQLAATAVYRLAETYRRTGRTDEAARLYERIVREFHDHPELAAQAAERLPQERLDAMERTSASPDLSPVTIHIQTEDGRPLQGFRVEMTARDERDGRRLHASGVSDESGLALARSMPYGEYRLSISEPSGWRAFFHGFTVEFGAPVEKVVIGPDPENRATLELDTALDEKAFKGLKFGEVQPTPRHRSRTVPSSRSAPEPGEESEFWGSFPELGNGIEEVGVVVQVTGTRSIAQPEGPPQAWHWRPAHRSTWVLATNEKASLLQTLAPDTVRLPESPPYFHLPPDGPAYSIAFLRVDRKPISDENALEVPPVEISLSVTRIIGKADPEVASSLGLAEADEIWLEAKLEPNSRWPTQILSRKNWQRETDNRSHLLSHTLSMEPGETRHFTFESPPLHDSP